MDNLYSLLVYADDHEIDVDLIPLKRAASLSVPLGDEKYGIAIDPFKIQSKPDFVHKLAHEIGHCATGSFYNRHSNFDCRQRHENRADKWAINKLIPLSDLDKALAKGNTEIWELAEYFGVTEQLMRRAVCYYAHGNLSTELYF